MTVHLKSRRTGVDLRTVIGLSPKRGSVILPVDVYDAVKDLAQAEDRSIANMAKVLLKEAMQARKGKP